MGILFTSKLPTTPRINASGRVDKNRKIIEGKVEAAQQTMRGLDLKSIFLHNRPVPIWGCSSVG